MFDKSDCHLCCMREKSEEKGRKGEEEGKKGVKVKI